MADFNLVQQNVQKMVDQGAPPEHIDGYLKQQGLTRDQFKANVALVGKPTSDDRQPRPAAPPATDGAMNANRKGSILPLSTDEQGSLQFDMSAGIPGAIWSGLTAPGDIATGKLTMNDQDFESRAMDTAGLMAGAPGVGKGSTFGRMVKSEPKAPTIEALKAEAGKGYKAARESGVEFNAPHVQSMADDILASFRREGFIDKNHPTIVNAIERLRDAETGVLGFNDLVGVREALKAQAGDFTNPTGQRWATLAIKSLDDYLENPRPGAVAAGVEEVPQGFTGFGNLDEAVAPGVSSGSAEARAADAGFAFKNANANYAAAKRGESLAGKQERAIDRAGVTNSGANLDNQLRQRVDEILARPKEGRGYTDQEIELLREIARGGVSENALRLIGNALGGGGGLGGIISSVVGAGAFGPKGAVLPLAGYAAKRGSAAITNRKINAFSEATRKRSPLYEQMERDAPMVPVGDARREALIRSMFMYDQSKPQPLSPDAVRAMFAAGFI